VGARVMGLQDPTAKMSKSGEAETDAVYLLDPPEVILRKFKRAVTDSSAEVRAAPDKPGVTNLLGILSACTGEPIAQLETRFSGKGYGPFKAEVADAVIACLRPIQERYQAIRDDVEGLRRLLRDGAERAAARAEPTLAKVHDVLGFVRP
jgi:tryptophanyl-tRNA synthetase